MSSVNSLTIFLKINVIAFDQYVHAIKPITMIRCSIYWSTLHISHPSKDSTLCRFFFSTPSGLIYCVCYLLTLSSGFFLVVLSEQPPRSHEIRARQGNHERWKERIKGGTGDFTPEILAPFRLVGLLALYSDPVRAGRRHLVKRKAI